MNRYTFVNVFTGTCYFIAAVIASTHNLLLSLLFSLATACSVMALLAAHQK